ncbi:MAG: class I SAM-dependent methyltransferase [Candidatus Dadabacteria bacterium]|nr:class I SAM-dependent methyltransferase [Candidatus Dadabacteria bacterium]
MSQYKPREYWEKRLRSRFTLKGVGNIIFDANYNEYLYKLQLGALKKAIAKHEIRLPGAKVLDVGCGTGFFSKFYIDGLSEVTGIDITEFSIQSLREMMPDGRFVTLDISSDNLYDQIVEGERFDIINVFNVLYHIVDDDKLRNAVENLTTCLKSGGYIFITDNLGEKDFSPAEHVRFRSLESYNEIFRNRINIVDVLPLYHFMNRRIDIAPLATNNLVSPLLFICDYILNKFDIKIYDNMKLLIGRKQN